MTTLRIFCCAPISTARSMATRNSRSGRGSNGLSSWKIAALYSPAARSETTLVPLV